MLRLYQHVAKELFILSFISICIFGASSYLILKQIELDRYEKLLTVTINTIKISGKKDLQKYVQDFYNATKMRMTVVDDKGNVVSDSMTNAVNMENHNNRTEIIEARKKEFGVAVRYSDTLKSDFLNVASKTTIDNSTYFIRITMPLDSIMKNFYIVWINAVSVFIAVLFIGLLWINRFNKNIKNEVLKVNGVVSAFSGKNYKTDFVFGFAKEFVEIGIYLKRLAKRLEKMARQKRKYTAKIKLASKQKGDIISAISHEFKNPIASIIGYAQTLNEDTNIDRAIRERFLEKILKNGQKISDMIDRLSLAAKIENGDLSPEFSDVDLDLLVIDVISLFEITDPHRIIKYEGETTIIRADIQMMEIVVTNLIHNGLKYSKDELVVKLKNGDFSVIDKGIGIAENEIDKITTKFYRSNSKSWDSSLGLGLAFVAHILKLHKLELKIQSVFGEGSTFSFNLQ